MKSRKRKRSKSVISAPMRDDDNTLLLPSSNLRISAAKSDDYIATQLVSAVKSAPSFRRLENRLVEYLGVERFNSIKSLYELKRNHYIVTTVAKEKSYPKMEALLQEENQTAGKEFVIVDVVSCSQSRKGVQVTVNHDGREYQIYIPEKLKVIPSQLGCVKTPENLIIDEFWFYTNCRVFKVGSVYIFRVVRIRNNGCNKIISVVDKCFNAQEVVSPIGFKPGDQIKCKVDGIKRRKNHKMSLVLSEPALYKKAPDEPKPKPKKQPKSKGYLHLIYTPMGNKR